ncbi:Linoleate 9S-lipoxygenase 5 [Castilleja foliolosa]|uniref:Lipoxygenase n=1 Tax=Castilleja foliolosa TaxID=1961234 RepID=A0ABD3CBS8_9LAMI
MEKLLGKVCVCGMIRDDQSRIEQRKKIKGTVTMMKNNVMDVTDIKASVLDRLYELFGKGVSLQLISSVNVDPASGEKGKLGKEAYLEGWVSKITSLAAEKDASFNVMFDWDESIGLPGAFIIRNHHHRQFYLKTVTLDDVPGHGHIRFECNSWVYPVHRYKYDRVFFTNKTYLPCDTPEPLRPYRDEELINLRGKGSGPLKEWDRVYDYAYYNDLGSPERGKNYERPVLGGGSEYPYPRRGRTGRRPNKKDPNSEKRLFLLNLNFYVPRDDRFNSIKFSDFIAYALKSLGQVLVPEIKAVFDKTINEFDTFQDVLNLYEGGIKLPKGHTLHKIRQHVPWELVRELIRSDGERFLKFPMPDVIKEDRTAWRTDEEFGREMLAGVNPVIIQLLQVFPPTSKLDRRQYGNQDSTITRDQVEKHMNGLTVEEAIRNNKLFILDHHDALMPYLRRINTTTTKTYATRTILLLQDNGTLKPLAIELSLPHENGDSQGSTGKVFTPCNDEHKIENSIWQLAKAYVAVNDSGYHQLISHWLNTHAVIEPFVIATNRQLSALHPIHKLLKPHFRDTIHINALARQILINAGGILERTVFPARYAMEMSSQVYKNWNLMEQALPADLIKRGVAVIDPAHPRGLRLLIEDYPYAVDGLEIWSAIETWVREYCNFYYPTDDKVLSDTELQSWWTELREVGHGDLKEKPWWPKMKTRAELIDSCTIIIWVASALHAAVNFGQYAYAGYLPNRPTVSRRFMPEPGTPEFAELGSSPDVAYLKTITAQFQTLLGVSLIEILSRHSADEIYLGQRDTAGWTTDDRALEAFKRFGDALVGIEKRIMDRNDDGRLRNRTGPVKMPYTLLYPDTLNYSRVGGLTGKGIPNSVSM